MANDADEILYDREAQLVDEIAYLKRLLNEDPEKPTYECRNQVALAYHEQIDSLTRECQRKQGDINELQLRLEARRWT